MDASSIVDFFRGRSIFVTGGTGFLGKVLIEKLLRCCPDIGTIYLLIRPKAGADVQRRLQQLTDCPVFQLLREKHAESLKKLAPISGDVMLQDLGISKSDCERLCHSVSVVFHSAATVRFNEPLKDAVEMNLKGTRRVLQLALKMNHLEAFIHVSTAYANCDKEVILEDIYTPTMHPDKVIQCVDCLPDNILQHITKTLIGQFPNTYTFTKGLTEYMLQEEGGGIPMAIVRPSIVTAALQEPMPGWVDNLNGPTGFIVGITKGFLRAVRLDENAVGDIIPVDFATNLMIAAAWHTAKRKPNNIVVYNCSSGYHNPITWGRFSRAIDKAVHNNPTLDAMWYPGFSIHKHKMLHKVNAFINHTIPALLFDGMLWAIGRRPKMMRIYERIERGTSCLDFFTINSWQFASHNALELSSKLSANERQMFDFDVRNIKWDDYLNKYVRGTGQFILKQNDGTMLAARRKMNRMFVLKQIVRLIGCTILFFIVSQMHLLFL